MTTKTILELFESKIVPRLKEELHIALRDIRHDLSELDETLRILGDQIDELNRQDPEDDIAEEDNG